MSRQDEAASDTLIQYCSQPGWLQLSTSYCDMLCVRLCTGPGPTMVWMQGVSGAGKTTLLDVLAGRKTGKATRLAAVR